MRLGAFIHVTNEEYDVLMSGNPQGDTILRNVLDRGDFEFNGDSYIPECEMERCNEAYGTDYETGDMGFDV